VEERTAELLESREQLRKLALHLEIVKEEERKRIARDIHDELGQNLLALRIDLSMLSARTSGSMAAAPARQRGAGKCRCHHPQRARHHERTAAAGAGPGLQAALEWQAAEFRKRSGLACVLALPGEEALAGVSPELATVLFRAVQEALSNVRRHAAARQVEITLMADAGSLMLSVADDGVGMAPASDAAAATIHLA
jgi:signal transduction histidine kinase